MIDDLSHREKATFICLCEFFYRDLSGLGLRNENSQINAYTAIQYYCVSNL